MYVWVRVYISGYCIYMYVCIYVSLLMYPCILTYMSMLIYLYMLACMFVSTYVCVYANISLYVCLYVCMYVCTYVCMCVFNKVGVSHMVWWRAVIIWFHEEAHTHTQLWWSCTNVNNSVIIYGVYTYTHIQHIYIYIDLFHLQAISVCVCEMYAQICYTVIVKSTCHDMYAT